MDDIEKVIENIESGVLMAKATDAKLVHLTVDHVEEVLGLLKWKEAVAPNTRPSAKGYWYTCGVCGWWLFEVRDTVHFDDRKRIHFCASCGRSVKWE